MPSFAIFPHAHISTPDGILTFNRSHTYGAMEEEDEKVRNAEKEIVKLNWFGVTMAKESCAHRNVSDESLVDWVVNF